MLLDLNQVSWLIRHRRLTELLEVLQSCGYEGESAIAFLRRIQLEFVIENR